MGELHTEQADADTEKHKMIEDEKTIQYGSDRAQSDPIAMGGYEDLREENLAAMKDWTVEFKEHGEQITIFGHGRPEQHGINDGYTNPAEEL